MNKKYIVTFLIIVFIAVFHAYGYRNGSYNLLASLFGDSDIVLAKPDMKYYLGLETRIMVKREKHLVIFWLDENDNMMLSEYVGKDIIPLKNSIGVLIYFNDWAICFPDSGEPCLTIE